MAPLHQSGENSLSLNPGEEITAEVVISNRNAAHSFPPEVRDLYEAWVEFEALDATGRTIYRSGFVRADGMLDESAHVYRTIILDEQGRAITRHQIWTTNLKAYDNTINAGRSDIARFRFSLPRESDGATGRRGERRKLIRRRYWSQSANRNYSARSRQLPPPQSGVHELCTRQAAEIADCAGRADGGSHDKTGGQ